MRKLRIRILAATIMLTAASFSSEEAAWPVKFLPGKRVGTVQTSLITEASGIVASRKSRGVLWVHNDSGAINTEGKLLGTYRIEGANCRDWEDIAIGPGPDPNRGYLYIGDIGDNSANRSFITVYRVPEPEVDTNRVVTQRQIGPAEPIELAYPDGAKDAETLMVDPLNGDIYVIAKREWFCRVYRAPYPQSTKKRTVMSLVANLPWGFATGGDVSPNGELVIARGMYSASMWIRPKGEELWRAFGTKYLSLELMREPQGEGICFDGDGRGYLTIGEMLQPPIYYFAASSASKE